MNVYVTVAILDKGSQVVMLQPLLSTNEQVTASTLVVTTKSHPEMVGDMSHVTLNCDLSKVPFVHF